MTQLDEPQVTQGDIARAKQAIVGDVPLMEEPPSTQVRLCRGLFQGTVWAMEAEIKELSGEDEEVIARALSSAQPTTSKPSSASMAESSTRINASLSAMSTRQRVIPPQPLACVSDSRASDIDTTPAAALVSPDSRTSGNRDVAGHAGRP